MKIFHVLFTRHLGGLEQAYIDVTESLVYKGHTVTALLHADAPYRELVRVYVPDVLTIHPRGFYDAYAVWKIRQHLKHVRPDIILAHNSRAILLLKYAAWKTGIPVIGVSHSYKKKHAVRADALIVLTEHMRQHFLTSGYPSERMEIIPNSTRLPEILSTRKRSGPVVIGAIGRLSPEKGFADFLNALELLKQQNFPFTAHIAGDGAQSDQLRRQAEALGLSDHICWKGWINDKYAFYRELDILCVPSREESFGLTVIEALAFGIPLITTDTPGPSSIVRHEIDGLIVPSGNANKMAKAIEYITTHPDAASQMVKSGRQRVEVFSFPAIAERWDIVLRGFMNDLRKKI